MKRTLTLLIACLPIATNAQDGQKEPPKAGIAGYIFPAYSNPKGISFEAGLSTVYTKRDAVGGLRVGVGYSATKYDAANIGLGPYSNLPGTPAEWRAHTFSFSAMIDPFPKKHGEVNFSLAAGATGMSTTVKAYGSDRKQVGDAVYSGGAFYPKVALGFGATGFIATAEILIPIIEPEYTELTPFNIGVIIYPRLLFPPPKQTRE